MQKPEIEKIEKQILENLKKVIDPELNFDIVKLGLIKKIEIGEWDANFQVFEEIKIIMTLTSVMCPFADTIIQEVEDNVNNLRLGEAQVELDFSEPWEPSMELKMQLGI